MEAAPPQPDFAVVYAFLGSLFDDATGGMDHGRVLEQDLPPQDRRTVHMLLGNLAAALRDPDFAALYAQARPAPQRLRVMRQELQLCHRACKQRSVAPVPVRSSARELSLGVEGDSWQLLAGRKAPADERSSSRQLSAQRRCSLTHR